MDTAIAVIIIAVAGYFVFRKIRNQLKAKGGGGCGCSGGCPTDTSAGSCCQGNDDQCSCDK